MKTTADVFVANEMTANRDANAIGIQAIPTRINLPGPPESTAATSLAAGMFQHVMVVPVVMAIALVMVAFINPIQPVTDSRVGFGNPVLLTKLALAAVAWAVGAWAFLNSSDVRRMFSTLPGVGLLSLASVFVATSVFAHSESAMISRGSAVILVGYMFFIAASVNTLGLRKIAFAMLIGSTIYLLVTWYLFLFVPSVGQFHEYTDATTTVARMGGLSHPNSIAREAGIALIITLSLIRGRRSESLDPGQARTLRDWWMDQTQLGKLAWMLIVGLSVATLVATISRTATLAAAAGCAMVLFDKLYQRRFLVLGLASLVVVLAGFLAVSIFSGGAVGDSATAALTKSGDIKELTSLTGRTDIWQEAIGYIAQRPLTGYGLDSAVNVMSKIAVGTHSLLLHVTFSGGVFAGLLMMSLLGMTIYHLFTSKEPLFRGIATYVVVSGLVEDTLFASFPCSTTLIWVAVLLSATLAPALRTLQVQEETQFANA